MRLYPTFVKGPTGYVVGALKNLQNEYWLLEQDFSREGCSLHPRSILKKSVFIATLFTSVLSVITFIMVLIMHQLSKPYIFLDILTNIMFGWLLFFTFVWIAHIMWICVFIIGRKVGRSKFVWGYIGKRWGKRIDQIVKKVLKDEGGMEVSDKEPLLEFKDDVKVKENGPQPDSDGDSSSEND